MEKENNQMEGTRIEFQSISYEKNNKKKTFWKCIIKLEKGYKVKQKYDSLNIGGFNSGITAAFGSSMRLAKRNAIRLFWMQYDGIEKV